MAGAPLDAAPPKLVVSIVVDQLRYDYLEKLEPRFSPGGFRLLMEKGAFLTGAHYDYFPTVTGAGHASYLTGAPPSVHGIIGNDWLDKKTLKPMNCVGDADADGVGMTGLSGKRSPRNFVGSNVADELRLQHGSRVVGISLKDRGAILPAGKKPRGAYWFDSHSGNFGTSTYYKQELPAWVVDFNKKGLPQSYIGKEWSYLLKPDSYRNPVSAPGAATVGRDVADTFKHTVRLSSSEGFESIVPTPFGNELLCEFARAAIDGEQLGKSAAPDLLCISFSSTDACGHLHGPYSLEMEDILLRLDRQLEVFFQSLKTKIGLQNVLIVLTADHGVAPPPEHAAQEGLGGERVDMTSLLGELMEKLTEKFGAHRFFHSLRTFDGQLYLNREALSKEGVAPGEVESFIRDWALENGNFSAAFTRSQLLEGRAHGLVGEKVVHGFYPERSGDVFLIFKPYVLAGSYKSGTTHGSPFSYDTHVPVLFFGAGFRPGRYPDRFWITDIAPTLCSVLRITEPAGCVGKPFAKILSQP
jgi:predicted AlkP superfamily pyrophosphatase or phosphodiesterase